MSTSPRSDLPPSCARLKRRAQSIAISRPAPDPPRSADKSSRQRPGRGCPSSPGGYPARRSSWPCGDRGRFRYPFLRWRSKHLVGSSPTSTKSGPVFTSTPIFRNSAAGHSIRSHSFCFNVPIPVIRVVPGISGDIAIKVSAASGMSPQSISPDAGRMRPPSGPSMTVIFSSIRTWAPRLSQTDMKWISPCRVADPRFSKTTFPP